MQNIDTIGVAGQLTSEQETALSSVQGQFAEYEKLEGDYHATRAMTFRTQYQFVANVGKLALETHVEKVLKFDVTKFRKAGFNVCALAVTGINVFAETDTVKRNKKRDRIKPVTQALDALDYFRAQHEHLTEAEFIAWWDEAGRP